MAKPKKFNLVNYTARDFNSLRQELIDYAKRYYPDTVRDFSSNSFTSLMVDTVAYTGDMLSFYLDYQLNESFLATAAEYNNVKKLAEQLGYKLKGSPAAVGTVALYAVVPASLTGLGPTSEYIPILKKNSVLGTNGGGSFILTEDVDFSHTKNEIVVARINTQNGLPASYAIKAYGPVVAGTFNRTVTNVGGFVKYRRVRVGSSQINEIISVFDSEGNEYYEVDYLSQDIIYKSEINVDPTTKEQTPNLMIPMSVPRRFVIDRTEDSTYLIFGQGTEENFTTVSSLEPKYVSLNRFGRNYVTDPVFDPANLIENDSMGICPVNTELTIIYRENSFLGNTVGSNQIVSFLSPVIDFKDPNLVSLTVRNQILASLECNNEEPIDSYIRTPTMEDIRVEAKNYYAAQARAVTAQDYESFCYRMPVEYGGIYRARAVRDPDSLKRNINIYVLSKNYNNNLSTCNSKTKQNLKIWLNSARMINDTVDILNGRIVNFGIEFEIIVLDPYEKTSVLNECLNKLRKKFFEPYHLGQPLNIFDIYGVLNTVQGVSDVVTAKFVNKNGTSYSSDTLNFARYTTPDGRRIIPPENVAFELKFGTSDVIGRVR